MVRRLLNQNGHSLHFWVLMGYLALVFLAGGGARADIGALVVLRPVSVLVCGFGLLTLTRECVREYRFLFALAGSVFLLVALHLIPLPPAIWTRLPGREIVAEIDRAAGLGAVWRPLTLVPGATWNAFFSLFCPLAVLLLVVQLKRDERFQLLPVLICVGLVSGLLGILQLVGSANGPLYFYEVTNDGAAVGLFANRNHAAVFLTCLFPMLAIYASMNIQTRDQGRLRVWMAVVAGVVLIPLLLVTGSRAGLILAVIGLVSVVLLYRKSHFQISAGRKGKKKKLAFVYGGLGVAALTLLTVIFARGEAFDRLVAPDQMNDARFQIWPPIADMAWKYFPFGSGIGSFVEVFQLDEPYALLSPAYTNHAHNDWLEIYMTGGAPALAILIVAVAGWARLSYVAWRVLDRGARETAFARLASIVLLMLALASIGDYPLRVPSLMCVAVIAAVWLSGGSNRASASVAVDPKSDGSSDESRLAA